MTLVLAAAIISFGSERASAQSATPPDIRMLLDLDLFRPHSSSHQDDGGNDSMLDQIQALRAMGYLNNSPGPYPPPASAGASDVPANQPINGLRGKEIE